MAIQHDSNIATEIEMAILGAMLLEKDAVEANLDQIQVHDFGKKEHKIIFLAISELFKRGESIDLLTVTNFIRNEGKLANAGGAFGITQLTQKVNSAANISSHILILRELAIKRRLYRLSMDIIHKVEEGYEDGLDLLELANKGIEQANLRLSTNKIKSAKEGLKEMMDDLEKKAKGEITGVPSGYQGLDKITGGWQDTDLIILAARPGMGKTALICNAVRNASIDFKVPSAIFSMEMSTLQLMHRLVSLETEIEGTTLRNRKLDQNQWDQLIFKTDKLAEAPIYIDDSPNLSIVELRTRARRLKSQFDIQLIVVDYLQLMKDTESKGNREQEISAITRGLKAMAKDLDIPVIAISQLSRKVEERGSDKRPKLADLRESGSIEQDADLVIFLYRPEYYGITADENGNDIRGITELIIAKHRNGSLQNAFLRFQKKLMKFKDYHIQDADKPEEEQPNEAAPF